VGNTTASELQPLHAIRDAVNKVKDDVARTSASTPNHTPVATVVAIMEGKVIGTSVGLADAYAFEAVATLPEREREHLAALLDQFCNAFLSHGLDIGERFRFRQRWYVAEAFSLPALHSRNQLLDVYLQTMAPVAHVVEILPADNPEDGDPADRSFLLKTCDAIWEEGLQRYELSPPTSVAAANDAADDDDEAIDVGDWYADAPGYRVIASPSGADSVVLPALGQVRVVAYGRSLLTNESPYVSLFTRMSEYEERVYIAQLADGSRIFTVRALHIALAPTDDVSEYMEPHDLEWLSAFTTQTPDGLAPTAVTCRYWGLTDHTWEHVLSQDGELHLMRITGVEVGIRYQNQVVFDAMLKTVAMHIARSRIPSGRPLLTVEPRSLEGQRILGEPLSGSADDWFTDSARRAGLLPLPAANAEGGTSGHVWLAPIIDRRAEAGSALDEHS
jgi:hypothetical protein